MGLMQWVRSWFTPADTAALEQEFEDRLERLFERAVKLKSERDELLRACKLLLLCFYDHIPGPFNDSQIGKFAERLVEHADGRRFDSLEFMHELTDRGRLED